MRYLVILRGSPGSGKTTWVKENGLEQYTISVDNLRLLCQSPELLKEGYMGISQKNDGYVWDLLYELLESRMDKGDFIIVDATHSKRNDFTTYKNLCEKYRYRLRCVDFTDVPIEVCKERNKKRDAFRFVPEDVIDKMYSRFDNFEIQKFVKYMDKDDFFGQIKNICINLDGYKKIHHIGDIHGCYTVLMDYLDGGFKDDEFYIFTGDYIDRGLENGKVVRFLCENVNRKNVVLLEGNHERWLWQWGNAPEDKFFECKSREFVRNTMTDLISEGVTKKDARMLCRKLLECFYYEYNGDKVICTHGGLSNVPEYLALISTEQMINGVGNYKDVVEVVKSFNEKAPENHYQFFGHRNIAYLPVVNGRCYIVDAEVEKGDFLRAVEFDKEGMNVVYTKNDVFREYVKEELPVGDAIAELNSNPNIEKKFMNGNKIISYNFDREVFRKRIWNDQTVKARGLFLDTQTSKVVMRAYEKFFNLNEMDSTNFFKLKANSKYPITSYVKYNGFLGLMGWHETEGLLFASKSSTETEFAMMFKDIANKQLNIEAAEQYIKENNVTFIFEVIDPINDPHIIKYDKKEVILLDVVKNDLEMIKVSYRELVDIGEKIGACVKEIDCLINTEEEFTEFVAVASSKNYKWNGEWIEGFVLEDSNGKMVKIKGDYYKRWKRARGIIPKLKYSRSVAENKLFEVEDNEFYGWLLKKKEEMPEIVNMDIIKIRDMYES